MRAVGSDDWVELESIDPVDESDDTSTQSASELDGPTIISRAAGGPSVSRRFPFGGGLMLALAGVSLVLWCGWRVRTAQIARRAASDESERQAKAAAVPKRAPAQVVSAQVEELHPTVVLDGTLKAVREADLGFKVSGQLSSVRVRLGEHVQAGQILAVLAVDDVRTQLNAARAAKRAHQAQLAMADDAADRTRKLVDTGAATQAAGTQSAGQRALAAAQLDAARAQVALAKAALRDHTLTAPFAGTVARIPSGVGMIVPPGMALFHLEDTSTLYLRGTVREVEAPLIEPGTSIRFRVADAGGKAACVVEGAITAVLSSVDAATRRVPVEAQVKNNCPQPLYAGSFARAEVVAKRPVSVVRVPPRALQSGTQDEVMVVSGGRVQTRRVSYFVAEDGALLIRSGVSAGEQVLLSPSAELHDGDVVAIGP
jgi:membrane fusion protein (multidrug efflux system)